MSSICLMHQPCHCAAMQVALLTSLLDSSRARRALLPSRW